MAFLIALLVAAIIAIIAYLFISGMSQEDTVQDRLKGMKQSKKDSEGMDLYQDEFIREKSLFERLVAPVADSIAKFMRKLTPEDLYEAIETKIAASDNFDGRGMTGFMTYILVLTLACFVVLFLYSQKHVVPGAKLFVLSIFCIAFGFGFPFAVLEGMVEERKEKIRRQLPDVLDLLCVSVQAGLAFDGSLIKVVTKMEGPLITELERMLQELRMGVTRRNALLRLAQRCGVKEVKIFSAALIQAEKLGVGLSQVLEIQSDNMREMRRQNARAKAAKLPSKILFPLLIFIFPVLFVLAMAPPLVIVMDSFLK